MTANNYKSTEGKPPVVSAVFIPFRRTLLALAAMMERQAVRHKLQGAKDPYQEWRQLPNAKAVLLEAYGRHSLDPWGINSKDAVGDHPGDLHLLHALWGAMAAHEKHLEELDDARAEDELGVGVPDYSDSPEQIAAREQVTLFPEDACCGAADASPLYRQVEGASLVQATSPGPIHGPASADWRETCHHWLPGVRGCANCGRALRDHA